MSRLFGCLCNQPERLVQALEPVSGALSTAEPIARWGLGYVQSGEVLLSRHPRPSDAGLDFYAALGELKSDYVIGYAADDDGFAGNANTQPYRYRHWLFAQDGAGRDQPDALVPGLLEHVPDFLGRNIKGKAAPELVFHMFLALLHDAGRIDDHNLDPAETRRALRDTLGLVTARMAELGCDDGPGNLVVTNSRSMVAVRLAGPLFVRRLKQQEDPKRPDTEFKAVLVVDGAGLPAEGFEELPPRTALLVNRDVTTDITELDAP